MSECSEFVLPFPRVHCICLFHYCIFFFFFSAVSLLFCYFPLLIFFFHRRSSCQLAHLGCFRAAHVLCNTEAGGAGRREDARVFPNCYETQTYASFMIEKNNTLIGDDFQCLKISPQSTNNVTVAFILIIKLYLLLGILLKRVHSESINLHQHEIRATLSVERYQGVGQCQIRLDEGM